MSETAQPTVKSLDDGVTTTGTEENHTPILPEARKSPENGGAPSTTENHTPIAPAAEAEANEEGGVTTLENHTPIAPPKGDA